MKKLLIFSSFFLLISMFLGATNINAQEVGISINVGSKSIHGNQIPLDLTIDSSQFTGPVKVEWVLPYGVTTQTGESTTFSSNVSTTDTIKDHLVVTPQFPGTFPITANVTGIYNGVSFSKSSTINLTLDQNMNLHEDGIQGNIRRIIYIISIVIAVILFIFFARYPFSYLKNRFVSWLNKEGES